MQPPSLSHREPYTVPIVQTSQVVKRNSGGDYTEEWLVTPPRVELVERGTPKPQRVVTLSPPKPTKGLRDNPGHDNARRWHYELSHGVEALAASPLQAAADLVVGRRTIRRAGKAPQHRFLHGDLPARTLICDLVYPLEPSARVTVEPYTQVLTWDDQRVMHYAGMSLGYYLWQLARVYHAIYHDERWGICGHVMADLAFTSLEVSDNLATVCVDS